MGRINVITVDGPSASGKGSLARKIAQIFDLSILDSGSLYRLYAFFLEKDIDEVRKKFDIGVPVEYIKWTQKFPNYYRGDTIHPEYADKEWIKAETI